MRAIAQGGCCPHQQRRCPVILRVILPPMYLDVSACSERAHGPSEPLRQSTIQPLDVPACWCGHGIEGPTHDTYSPGQWCAPGSVDPCESPCCTRTGVSYLAAVLRKDHSSPRSTRKDAKEIAQ